MGIAQISRIKPPPSYDFQITFQEDFNDGRYHDEGDLAKMIIVDIADIQRIYYTSSGKLLNIQDASSSCIVIKVQRDDDVKWMAFEIPIDPNPVDSDSEDEIQEECREIPPIAHPLSLMEYIIRLCAVELQERCDHYQVEDQKLILYLANDADISDKSEWRDKEPGHVVHESPFKVLKTPVKPIKR